MFDTLKYHYRLLFTLRMACLALASVVVFVGWLWPVSVLHQSILYGTGVFLVAIVPILLDRAGQYSATRVGYIVETLWRVALLGMLLAWSFSNMFDSNTQNILLVITFVGLLGALFIAAVDPISGSGYNTACSDRVHTFCAWSFNAMLLLLVGGVAGFYWLDTLSFMPTPVLVVALGVHLAVWRYVSWTTCYDRKPMSTGQPVAIWARFFEQDKPCMFWAYLQQQMEYFPFAQSYFLEKVIPSLPLDRLLTYFDPEPWASIRTNARNWYGPLTNAVLMHVKSLDSEASVIWAVCGPDHEKCVAELRKLHARKEIPKMEMWALPG